MDSPDKIGAKSKTSSQRIIDEYGNVHYIGDELARGGQGVVFRTTDVDLAIKQPLDKSGKPDMNANMFERFQNIRRLTLPPRIPVSLPLAILRHQPGYVMRLLNGMTPFEVFEMNGLTKVEIRKQEIPEWLVGIPDEQKALEFYHYAETGSTRRRLFALSKCASILARLHSAGLVYGDISLKNVFIGDGDSGEVWLIDADNLRFERIKGGKSAYTPRYGAPEVVQGHDASRPRTDCWAFAVMAFRMLTLWHPFIGRKVLEPENDEGDWDTKPIGDGVPADLDEQAYAGFLPFIDDEEDGSNAALSVLSRELVTTPALRRLFQETLGVGRTEPHRRPAMVFWAKELAKAADRSLDCPECKMSYFGQKHEKCPYCSEPRPAFARAMTGRWESLISAEVRETALPHRLFHPFSFEHNDDTQYEAVFDFAKKTVKPVRGTRPFPDCLTFEFIEESK
jgi:serine/threonine protein kinase